MNKIPSRAIEEIASSMNITETEAKQRYNSLYDDIMVTVKDSMKVLSRAEKDVEISKAMILHGMPPGRYLVLEQHLSAYFGQEVV